MARLDRQIASATAVPPERTAGRRSAAPPVLEV